ncbi:MAG: alpha/beta hydrolase [Lentisphaerae bacterium]|nr:alpha/beta hydrolase [Lentisphaerota bacterium]
MKISIAALWKKFYFRIPVYACVAVVFSYTAGVLAMDKLLFPGAADQTARPPKSGNITLKSGNAELDALYHLPAPGMPVILYSHGNGETLSSIKPLLNIFIRQGYGVIAYDYAGYGNSTGYPSEKQACMDIEAAYSYLAEKHKFTPKDIVIMGYSVGSGPSCYLAEKIDAKALIIISGFASAAQVLLPFPVPFDKFPNAERLKNCKVPLLIIHGRNDKIVPVRNGEKLFSSSIAPAREIYYSDAGHNDIFYKTPGFFHKIKNFLEKCSGTEIK